MKKHLSGFAALAFFLIGCGSNGIGSQKIGASGQACTAGGGCDPGLACRASDHVCVAPPPDAGPPPDTVPVSICSAGALGGIGIPAGTVVTASSSYAPSTPDVAIDNSLTTGWNSGGFAGWLKLQFPKPTAISAIHIAAGAKPTTNEIYTVTDELQKTIGTGTRQVVSGSPTGSMLEPITVTPGTYSNITVTVNGGASWVQIVELSLINDECPFACGCETRLCGDDGCGLDCGSCEYGELCITGRCVPHME